MPPGAPEVVHIVHIVSCKTRRGDILGYVAENAIMRAVIRRFHKQIRLLCMAQTGNRGCTLLFLPILVDQYCFIWLSLVSSQSH